MKSKLRQIFGHYDNKAFPGYEQAREALRKGVYFHYKGSLGLKLREQDVIKILTSQNWIQIVSIPYDLYGNWHKLCLFEGDTMEISIEGYGTRRTRLESAMYPPDMNPMFEEKDFEGEVCVKLRDQGEFSLEQEKIFFGTEQKLFMELFKKQILNKATTYLEEVYNLQEIGGNQKKLLQMKECYKRRLLYWNIKNVSSLDDKKQLFLTDFGIKDPSLFFNFYLNFSTTGDDSDLEKSLLEQENQMSIQCTILKEKLRL